MDEGRKPRRRAGTSRASKYRRISEDASRLLDSDDSSLDSDDELVSVEPEHSEEDQLESVEVYECPGIEDACPSSVGLNEGENVCAYPDSYCGPSPGDLDNYDDVSDDNDEDSLLSWLTDSDLNPLEELDDIGDGFDDLEEEEESYDTRKLNLREKLQFWAVTFKVSKVAVSNLLKLLKSADPNEINSLPLDARTLVRTPRTAKVIDLESGGQYYHYGLERGILSKLKLSKQVHDEQDLEIVVGIDGIPLFKSSKKNFHPISGKIISIPDISHKVFPIGIYCGDTDKPKDVNEFLEAFITELTTLCEKGVQFRGRTHHIIFKGFVCDCPEKSYIMGIINSNGHSSCTKCDQPGVWSYLCNRMYFPQNDAKLRTHEDFINAEDEYYHRGYTPLLKIPSIDFIAHFPLDYMHLVCLGVIKTLMLLWVRKSKNNAQLSPERIWQASGRMLTFEKFIPSEFPRRTRPFEDVGRMKAAEFRLFGGYVGPFVMDDILDEAKLNNLFLLYMGLKLLLNPQQCQEFKETARAILIQFVEDCKVTYAPNLLTHNFHNLIHLPDNLEDFKNLEDCSAYDFETFLGMVKLLLAKGDQPLQQVANRLEELDACPEPPAEVPQSFPCYSMPHHNGPLLDGCSEPQYLTLKYPNFKLSPIARDCCFTTVHEDVVIVRNICTHSASGSLVIVGRKFEVREDAFNLTCPSSKLGVYFVSNLSDLMVIPVSDIHWKNMMLPFKSGYVVQPILHTLL